MLIILGLVIKDTSNWDLKDMGNKTSNAISYEKPEINDEWYVYRYMSVQ